MSAPENACDCKRCASACEHKPGWFTPDQIAPLAEALGLTEQELFDQHLQIDWLEADDRLNLDHDVFILTPAATDGRPGDMWGHKPYGRCRWLSDEGRCQIHELGKPAECAHWRHDLEREADIGDRFHTRTGLQWDTPEHQAKIRELLGREPKAAGAWSMLDDLFYRATGLTDDTLTEMLEGESEWPKEQ